MTRLLRTVLVAAALAWLVDLRPVRAHELERTTVRLQVAGDGAFVLEVTHDANWLLLRLESFAGTSAPVVLEARSRDARLAALSEVFVDRVVLFVDGREVRPESAQYIPPSPSSAGTPMGSFHLRGRMPAGSRVLRWYYGLVMDPYPLAVERADGTSLTEWVGGDAWSTAIGLTGPFTAPSRWTIGRQYLALGFMHILPKGVDHMLFVLGLFLLGAGVKPLLVQVTSFTVAHSITLGLSMYGIVGLPPRVVEPLIALSIAYVAVENLCTREVKPRRIGLVFLFGLLHGLGFAGVLRELGLPRDQFLTALLAFNLGVEGGQLTVIALAALAVAGVSGRDWYRRRVVVPASLLIAAVGLYWTLARVTSID